jgi:hypothetical protein
LNLGPCSHTIWTARLIAEKCDLEGLPGAVERPPVVNKIPTRTPITACPTSRKNVKVWAPFGPLAVIQTHPLKWEQGFQIEPSGQNAKLSAGAREKCQVKAQLNDRVERESSLEESGHAQIGSGGYGV